MIELTMRMMLMMMMKQMGFVGKEEEVVACFAAAYCGWNWKWRFERMRWCKFDYYKGVVGKRDQYNNHSHFASICENFANLKMGKRRRRSRRKTKANDHIARQYWPNLIN